MTWHMSERRTSNLENWCSSGGLDFTYDRWTRTFQKYHQWFPPFLIFEGHFGIYQQSFRPHYWIGDGIEVFDMIDSVVPTKFWEESRSKLRKGWIVDIVFWPRSLQLDVPWGRFLATCCTHQLTKGKFVHEVGQQNQFIHYNGDCDTDHGRSWFSWCFCC